MYYCKLQITTHLIQNYSDIIRPFWKNAALPTWIIVINYQLTSILLFPGLRRYDPHSAALHSAVVTVRSHKEMNYSQLPYTRRHITLNIPIFMSTVFSEFAL